MGIRTRLMKQRVMISLSYLSILLTLGILGAVIFFTFLNGIKSWNLAFFTEAQKFPLNPRQGISHAIQGSLILSLTASAIAAPISILAAIYLTEYADERLRESFDSILDVMASTPSIVVGVVSYILIVLPLQGFSALSGAVALAIMMMPIMTRACEDALMSIERRYREAGLALGLHKWRVSLSIILRMAKGGVLTGFALAFGRVFGETAPLLMTALGSRTFFSGFFEPVSSITLLIYEYSKSPFEIWIDIAWGASLLLMLLTLGINVSIRLWMGKKGG
jgi:phosphate transport system permease protein